jgi:RNA polymerase sigma-70 factor (ECF subfamily)
LEAASKNIHQELIDRCRKNDQKAQLEIYKLYYKTMYNTSLRILNHIAEAEDVMQESFLDAFRKIEEYKGEGSFGGWLRRIVVNNSIDSLKKRKETLPLDDVHFEQAEVTTSADEHIEYKVDEIKRAVPMLAEEHRIILSLLLFEGYDHEEIAQILNISNNTSRTRFSRAKGKLLKIMADQRSIKMFHPN